MNNKDKTLLINKILQLEKSIDSDINNALSEIRTAQEDDCIKIAKKYSIGERDVEYYTSNLLLQKNYLMIILERMTELGDGKKMCREDVVKCSGYLFGPRTNEKLMENE